MHASLSPVSVRLHRSAALILALLVLWTMAALVLAPSIARAGECSGVTDKSDCPQTLSFESARGVALGTGVRASAVSSSALAYSPGALAMGNLYHIEGNIDYIGVADTVALGGAVIDSSTSKIGAGIGLRGFLSGDGGYDGLDGRLGLALALSDAFSIGLLGRYLTVTQSGNDVAQGLTLDASIRVVPTEGLHIDVGALNFVDLGEAEVPVTISTAVAFAIGDSFSLGADMLVDLSTFEEAAFIAGGGLEFLAGNSIPLRAGYRADLAREIHSISAGIGYTDEQVGFDLGLRQDVAGFNETRVMAGMRYYVH